MKFHLRDGRNKKLVTNLENFEKSAAFKMKPVREAYLIFGYVKDNFVNFLNII